MSGDAFKAFEARGWSERAGTYATLMARATAGAIEPLLDVAGVAAGTRVLDVGTGLGALAAAAAGRGAQATGADLATGMVAAARARHPDVEFVEADAERLPFADGHFDAVLGAFVVNHLPEPERAAAELARVGGRVALAMWGADSAHLALPSAAASGLPDPTPPGPSAERFADPTELARLVGAATVTTITYALPVGSLDELWDGIRGGTVRTAARLAAATESQRERVRAELARLAERYRTPSGLELPITVHIAATA